MVLYLLHRLPDDNEDNAPFQIDLGVQGKQLQRVHCLPVPPVGWRNPLLWLLAPRRFRASPKTYLKSHWPSRSPPLDLFDVPLAQEDDHPRVPDQAEDSRLPIRLLLRNKYLKLLTVLVYR